MSRVPVSILAFGLAAVGCVNLDFPAACTNDDTPCTDGGDATTDTSDAGTDTNVDSGRDTADAADSTASDSGSDTATFDSSDAADTKDSAPPVDTGTDSTTDTGSPDTSCGECSPGSTDISHVGCTNPKFVHTRTCSAGCTWDLSAACAWPRGWSDMAAPATFGSRLAASSAWTGTELIVWGGTLFDGSPTNDGAAYNPGTDTWRTIATPSLSGRSNAAAVWTGSKMIVWGGINATSALTDGAAYTLPDTWTSLPSSSLAARRDFTMIWAPLTHEVIIWGGSTIFSGSFIGFDDGAAYSTVTGTWRTLAAAPISGRSGHRALWNGSKMIVFGGVNPDKCGSAGCGDGAAYDPWTDTWSTLATVPSTYGGRSYIGAVQAGTRSVFLDGGSTASAAVGTGAAWDSASSAWQSIAAPAASILANSDRTQAGVWWSGSALFIWGGYAWGAAARQSSGASYDFGTSSWTAMPSGGPSARLPNVAVWDGSEALVWGSMDVAMADGKVYKP